MSNDKISENCIICNRPLDPEFKPDEKKVSLDMTRFSLKVILIEHFKSLNILSPLIIPIFSIIYFSRKLIKKSFPSLIFLGKQSRLHLVDLKCIRTINKNTLGLADKTLIQTGFSHLIDYEDKSRAQAIFTRLYINRSFGAYAGLLISRQTGKTLYVTFTAITSGKKVIEYANTHGLGEEQDQHIFIKYVPGKSILQLWQIFSDDLKKFPEERLCPELDFALPIFNQTRIHSIDIGLKRGVLLENALLKDNSSVVICYNHPSSIAVRKCQTCGISICEACCKEANGNFYCTKCTLPETATRILRAPWGYAGAAIRFCASLIDTVITAAVFATVYFLLQYLLKFINPPHIKLIAFIVAQPFLVFFLFWHYFARVALKGQTLGKAVLGLRIISNKGTPPGYATATIRFLTVMISLIFIFPLVGYAIIPFHRKKTGFQDKLSGSLVVTKNPGRKALFASIIAAPLLLSVVVISVVILSNLFKGNQLMVSEVYLPVKWEKIENKITGTFNITTRENENRCFIFDSTSITCLNIWKGDTIWRNNSLHRPRDITNDTTLPFFITESDTTTETAIVRIGDREGSVTWKQKLPIHDSWNFYTDSKYVVAYTKKQIIVLNHSGEILWEKKFTIPDIDEYYGCSLENRDNKFVISTEDDNDSIIKIIAFNAQNGEQIDSVQNMGDYDDPINLSNGYQCKMNENRQYEIRSVNSDSVLFRVEDTLDYIEYCSYDSSKSILSPVLYYGRLRAYNSDGTIAFKYPDNFYLDNMTESYLIFNRSYSHPPSQKLPELLFIDKFSGQIVKTVSDSAYNGMYYISENDHALFLKANQKTFTQNTNSSNSLLSLFLNQHGFSKTIDLVVFNKKDLSLGKITLGKNIKSVIPSSKSDDIFIQCFDRCGVYSLQNANWVK